MTGSQPHFLPLPAEFRDPARARYAVLPVSFEGTVCYKTGTASGPLAILDASLQVELYDEELGAEFHQAGIVTLPMVPPAPGVEAELERVRQAALGPLREGKFLLTLGGEHSITSALVDAVIETRGPVSVLQIDAHADLRDVYGGSRYSHGCVMRRVLEKTQRLCQVGVRSYSLEEARQCPGQVANFIPPADMDEPGRWIDRALSLLGEKVYVTIDIDGFDPAVAPGTGTPEPGGMSWRQVLSLLRRVCAEREVVSADIVEVRPIPPNQIVEYVAARLGYKIIAYTQAGRR